MNDHRIWCYHVEDPFTPRRLDDPRLCDKCDSAVETMRWKIGELLELAPELDLDGLRPLCRSEGCDVLDYVLNDLYCSNVLRIKTRVVRVNSPHVPVDNRPKMHGKLIATVDPKQPIPAGACVDYLTAKDVKR